MVSAYEAVRFIHVIGAAMWFGASMFMEFRLNPARKAAGPVGGQFMAELLKIGGLGIYLIPIATVTILAGGYIYGTGPWTEDAFGSARNAMMTTGVALALVAWGLGMFVSVPTENKMKRIVARMDGPPTPEQGQEMAQLAARMGKVSRVIAVLLVVTIVLMVGQRMA